jgi:hypothetical protein
MHCSSSRVALRVCALDFAHGNRVKICYGKRFNTTGFEH